MSRVTREDGHLVVAAIRVLAHREERPPRPEEVAVLLGMAPEVLRARMAILAEAGVLAMIESAFDTHLEIRDHLRLEELEAGAQSRAMDEDLADFARRQQEQAAKMSRLFDEGDHERRQAERVRKMEEELRDFRLRKPRNPFAADD
jgi:hypothetical protein